MIFKVIFISICLMVIYGVNGGVNDNEIISDDYPSSSQYISGVKVYSMDRDCAMVGGVCIQSSDCVVPTSKKGLCPSNQLFGVECCYEPVIKPAPCRQHQGACMSRCHKSLLRPATDCEDGQVCCVLID